MLRHVLSALGTVLVVCIGVRVAADFVTPAIPALLTVTVLVGIVALMVGIWSAK